ncbi:hypothetical protein [Muribaculum intestinale]|uniref:hypothetical protein n=1 Tax=Muribaculum intestinale TaxID=1796646 RepID=UPI0025B75D82|nr:hypothetical protein [Muribaculum intestinale]
MIKDIKYSGYSAQPSDYECQDGDLATSINLINEDGNITPILQPKVVMTMPEEGKHKIVFIHETTAFKHYIIYDESSYKLMWKNSKSGSTTELGYAYGLSHCNAVGNTLIVFTGSEMHYYLWTDNAYTDLGDSLPDIRVSFGLVGHPRLLSQTDGKFTINFAEGIAEGNIRSDFSDANKTRITEQVMAKLNKFIREQTIDKGRFCFPFFVRYALRLYDGSLVCHSAPILMNPSTRPAPLVMWGRAHGKNSYTEANDCDIMMVAAALDYRVSHGGDWYALDKWKDLIKSIDVFISKPIYTYDQNGKISNLTDTDNFQTSFIGKLYHDKFHCGGATSFPETITEDCMIGPISIDSVGGSADFLTRYMEWTYSRIYQLYFTNAENRPYPGETFHLPEYTDGKNAESIRNCATFYHLYSISLEDAKATTRKEVPIENDYLQSLTSREVMTDDYLTHDRLVASTSQVYNSRLNLSGVKRQLFKGFAPDTMFAHCDRELSSYMVSGRTVSMSIVFGYDNLSVTVYVKEGGQTYALNTSYVGLAPWGSGIYYSSKEDADNKVNGKRMKKSYGAYLFYPNVNAVKMVIGSQFGGEDSGNPFGFASIVVDLQPHDYLNGAFAMLDYDSVRVHNYTSGSVPGATVSPETLLDCGNKVYTSEVNNPFYFPLLGINTVGTGKILGISTAAKALSEGQFGQFPLYAFTEDGVWAMEVTETGTYRAKQPITRDVCINPDGITQIDSAVLFPTDRGIMLISGSTASCISEAINNDAPFKIDLLPHMSELHSLLGHEVDTCLPVQPFTKFLKECRMIYDYPHQRIIVYNEHYSYAYVLSLKTKLWGMMYSQIRDNVNSYPEALAVTNDGKMVNFAETDGEAVGGLLVTRPLKLDAADVLKTVDTIIQRGNFRKGHVQSVVYGSRDLYNWSLVWSSKDHYLRGFRGTPYKYFRIALLCNLAKDESIYGTTVQYDTRKTNQPR